MDDTKRSEEEIRKRYEELQKKLKEEEEKLKELHHAEEKHFKQDESRAKVTEVEFELDLNSVKKFGSVLYTIFIKHRVLVYLLLLMAVILGVYIRDASLPSLGATPLIGNNYLGQGGSLSGLDPYRFYVEMNEILASGNVPSVQYLEYLPIGISSRSDEPLLPFFGAYSYRILQPFVPAATPMTWFMLIPVFAAALITVLIFFIILEMFEDYWAAALGSFIFPIFQTVLSRTIAGFDDKTAMGYLFIFLTIFFLTRALKRKKVNSKLLYGTLTAIAMGLTMVSSGYGQDLLIIIPAVFILMILFDKFDKNDMYAFLPFALWMPIRASMMTVSIQDFTTSFLVLPMYLSYLMILFKVFVYDRYKSRLKLPFINAGFSILIYCLIIGAAVLFASGPRHLVTVVNYGVQELTTPLNVGIRNPVSLTIAEYGTMTLSQRICDFGFLTAGCGSPDAISVNLLILFIGIVFLTYLVLKRFRHWQLSFLLLVPIILLINGGTYTAGAGSNSLTAVAIMTMFIPLIDMLFHRKDGINSKAYFALVLVFTLIGISLVLVFMGMDQIANYYKDGIVAFAVVLLAAIALDKFDDTHLSSTLYYPAFIAILIALFISNIQTRLIDHVELWGFILVPFAVLFMARKTINFSRSVFRNSKALLYFVVGVLAVLFIIFAILDVYNGLTNSYAVSAQSGSGLALWGPTMLWMSQNTPINSSIISWWDYGYWEMALANRTSVADGSNAYGYQSMIAKYFFEATSPYQYATYLHFLHQPTYAVISGSEILKFSAISTIALNYTQFTPMGENPNAALNSQNIGGNYKYVAVFGGNNYGIGPLESNITINGVPWAAGDTLVVEVLIPFNYTNGTYEEGNPYGVLYNQLLQQVSNPMLVDKMCTYGVGCKVSSTTGIPGAIMMLNASNSVNLNLGGYPQAPGGYIPAPIKLSDYGNGPSLLFMPDKSLDTLFTKLYLLNETVPGIKLVFTDGLPVDSLLSIENQVLTNINVYEINYTALSKYMLTQECSLSGSAVNYCDNLDYLPAVFENNTALLNTPI